MSLAHLASRLVPLALGYGTASYAASTSRASREAAPPTACASYAVAANLARRLGLTLQGDAQLNFVFATPQEKIRVGMTGCPYGRRAAFASFTWGDPERLPGPRGTTQALWVATAAQLPDFEVTLRHPLGHVRATPLLDVGTGLSEAKTGNPILDRKFRVVTRAPRFAPQLQRALAVLVHQPFVHLLHTERAPGLLTSLADGLGLPHVLRAAELHLYALELLACAVEQRPTPAMRETSSRADTRFSPGGVKLTLP